MSGRPRPLPLARVAWVLIAGALLIAGIWDGRAALSSAQPVVQAVNPDPLPARRQPPTPIVTRTAHEVDVSAPEVRLAFDLTTGRLTLRWFAAGRPIASMSGWAGARLRGNTGSGLAGELLAGDYAHHRVTITPLSDLSGQGTEITFIHDDPRYPPLRQRLTLYPGSPGLVLQTELGKADGPALDASRIDPLVISSSGSITLPGTTDPLVFAISGLTTDHMPRQFIPLSVLSPVTSLPYLTFFADPSGGRAFLAAALRADAWFPSVLLSHDRTGLSSLSLTNIGPVTGSLLEAEPFLLGLYPDGPGALRAYAAMLGRLQPPPPGIGGVQLGWSSWGAYELAVSDGRVRRNVDFMATHLRSLGYTTIHIDDGWEQRYGDWQPGRNFPDGMAAIVAYIHAHHLKASIWFAPFLIAPNSWPARVHPEWLLRNVDGSPASIVIAGPTYMLDVTNPAALAYVRSVCARIRTWGFDAVKLDFLYTGAKEGQRYRFDLNGMQAYNAAMTVVRDALEADPHHPIYLTGVQQGFLPSGFFQAWRVGRDIESRTNAGYIPTWDLVVREALAVNTFAFADGTVYATDPDDLLLRSVPGAQNLSEDELQTYATMVALGGTVWLSGDDLPSLARQGRLSYLANPEVLAVVRSGRAGMPVRLADQADGPAPLWSALQSDGSAVVGLFNWSNTPRAITVPFSTQGLIADRPYTVRDLWARADLGRYTGGLTLTLRPHQSYLLRLATP